jgi:uncharacterized protein (TIGR03546 family)
MFWLPWIKPVRFLVSIFRDLNSPRQIAAGFALGMLVGLVPKGNLTAAVLATLILMLRVNLAAGMLGALVFSWVGLALDPIADRIGYFVLAQPRLLPVWQALWEQPLMPWTALNNTVVLGSLLLGISLWYPVYHVASRNLAWILDRYAERIQGRLKRYRMYHLLVGADVASSWRWRA